MSVPISCTNTLLSLFSSQKQQALSDALESACQAASELLTEFETLLEGIINHQVKQGHFKKKYDIPWETTSEYHHVNGARYDHVHEVYSDQKNRAKAVETLCSVTKLLTRAYKAMPSDGIETWHATIKQLDALAHDKNVEVIVKEYMDTLSANQRHFLTQGIEKNGANYQQVIHNLDEAHRLTSNPLFEFSSRLLAYEGIHSLYNDQEKRARIAEAFCNMTRTLSNVYEAVPDSCIAIWQATLEQWDALELDARIDALAQEYLDTLPKDAYNFVEEKIETNLTVCREALEDVREAQRENPKPILEFFSKVLTIGIYFFERMRHFLQKLVEKEEESKPDWDEHETAA